MRALLSLELKKLIFNKKNIVCAVALLVVALIFVGTYDSNNEKKLQDDIKQQEYTLSYQKTSAKADALSCQMSGQISLMQLVENSHNDRIKMLEDELAAYKKDDGFAQRKAEYNAPFRVIDGYCYDDSKMIADVDTYNRNLRNYPTVYERLNGRIFFDEVRKTYIPFLFILFLIFLSSESFSEEFHACTSKFLYTQPVSITKIYFAKFFAVIIYALSIFAIIYGSIFLILGFTRGFGNFDTQYAIDARAITQFFKEKSYQTVAVINEKTLILYSIPFYVLILVLPVLFTFFISSLSKNSIVSALVPALIFAIGYFVYKYLMEVSNLPDIYTMQYKILPDIMQLIPFPYKNVQSAFMNLEPTDYNPNKLKNPQYSLMTYPTELTVLASYVILFFTLSFTIVKKRSKC